MRYPRFLKEKDVIGYVSPSFGCAIEPYKSAFENAVKTLEKRGFGADVGPNCYKTDGVGISSTPKNCGDELNNYYESDKNQALFSCGGGELMCETIDYVDFDRIKNANPKWYMGYSDNTNMTFLLPTICDIAAIYGPNAGAFGMEPWHKSVEDALDVVTGRTNQVSSYDKWEKESLKSADAPLLPYNVTEPVIIKKYIGSKEAEKNQDIKMTGRLLGGCLDCLSNLVGTKYDKVKEFASKYESDGILWFLEACDLNVFSMRRAVWQLDRAGWFENARGFIIGRPYHFGEEMMGLDQYSAILGILAKYNVPIIMDADVGHLSPMMPLVEGSMATVKSEKDKIHVSMKYE